MAINCPVRLVKAFKCSTVIKETKSFLFAEVSVATYLLGVDVGTTGSKAILLTLDGNVVVSASTEYQTSMPRPLWAEQDPRDWWRATVASIRRVLSTAEKNAQVVSVGLTGQMHGLVLLDKLGNVLRPCIMWNDQRNSAQCEAIAQKIGAQTLLDWIGNPILPGFTAPKVLWVREHEPKIYGEIARVLLPKDYVRYRLTGDYATEVSDASGTALFDVRHRRWSENMLAALDLPHAWMPQCFESSIVSAKVSSAAADETGLAAGTPVIGGSSDQAAQAIGTGIVHEGVTSITIGTSGVVFAQSDTYRAEPHGRLHAFCHAVPEKWHLMGVMLSAGGSFRWYRDALGGHEKEIAKRTGRDVYDVLTSEAARVPAGCEGLLFLPYLTGERTPYPDPNARGVFFGLTARHSKAHMTRAVLEGVSFGLRDSLELMRALKVPIRQVRASGGGARSALWRQILADVFAMEIATVDVTEGAAYGAALLAGVGAGVYPSVESACDRLVKITGVDAPGPSNSLYSEYYAQYRALYPKLKSEFQAMARLVERQQYDGGAEK